MLDVVYHGALQGPATSSWRWANLLDALRLRPGFDATGRPLSAPDVTWYLVLDVDQPGSVIAAVGRARENLRTVRDQIPADLWNEVNRFHRALDRSSVRRDLGREPHAVFDLIRNRCQTIGGVAAHAMPRSEGYRFLMTGWALEAALMSCRLLRVQWDRLAHAEFDAWASTLRSVSGFEAFRAEFGSATDRPSVARFLMQSRIFPRSVLFSLERAESHVLALDGGETRSAPRQLLGRVRSELEFADLALELADGPGYFDRLEESVRSVATALGPQYFRRSEDVALTTQLLAP